MKVLTAIGLSWLSFVCAHTLPIAKDISKATQLAQLYNKPLIMTFTGNNWCQLSQKVTSNLLYSQEFADALGNSFIFAHLDFPKMSATPDERYEEVRQHYHITSFPTLVMVQPNGKEITRFSYSEQSPQAFAEAICHLFAKYLKLQEEMERIDLSAAQENQLKNLYQEALELRCPSYITTLLEHGLQSGTTAFFPVERYAQLVVEGKEESDEGRQLKDEVIKRDPENREGARMRLALLDFQSHQDDPDRAVEEPLSYIHDLGKRQDDNLWRLHCVISDYFARHGREEEAKLHARRSSELLSKEKE